MSGPEFLQWNEDGSTQPHEPICVYPLAVNALTGQPWSTWEEFKRWGRQIERRNARIGRVPLKRNTHRYGR